MGKLCNPSIRFFVAVATLTTTAQFVSAQRAQTAGQEKPDGVRAIKPKNFADGVNEFETRIGELRFEQGYPTEKTARNLYDEDGFSKGGSSLPVVTAGGRDVAAYLCRRYTTATLAELSHRFGLSHPDSSSDLVKRAKRKHETSTDISKRIGRIEKRLGLNPESRDWPRESPPLLSR